MNRRAGDRIVYSTGTGTGTGTDGRCPDCGRPRDACRCPRDPAARRAATAGALAAVPARGGVVRVARQTQGRGGRGVTVITGLPLAAGELAALARELKQRCGSGGTVRGAAIEIQGEHRDLLVAELTKRGYDAKRAGG